METAKPLEFKGTAGGYFIFTLVSIVASYIPILGWAFLLNYTGNWFAENAMVNGKKVAYKASYGESLKFVFLNSLLIFLTIGVYFFWYVPKMYRYLVDHAHYVDEVAASQPIEVPVAQAPVNSIDPMVSTATVSPVVPSAPVDPTTPGGPTGSTPSVG